MIVGVKLIFEAQIICCEAMWEEYYCLIVDD